MKIKMINQCTVNDLNTESVKTKLTDIFKPSDTLDWTGSYGVDLHDPASCFAAIMTKPEDAESARVYHCRFEPEQSSLDVSYNKEAFDDFPASGEKINNHIYKLNEKFL